jgi:hypothetical protein
MKCGDAYPYPEPITLLTVPTEGMAPVTVQIDRIADTVLIEVGNVVSVFAPECALILGEGLCVAARKAGAKT